MTGDPISYPSDCRPALERLVASVDDVASSIELLFITNLRSEEVFDVGPDGISNVAQYYTRREADEIIQSLRSLGVTVTPFFSELEFLRAVVALDPARPGRHRVVYTTAEGGHGSGRRAMVPSVCRLLGLPVMNSGAHASSLARHKHHAAAVLRNAGIMVPGSWYFRGTWQGDASPPRGRKVIVKPTYESMCIGVDHDSVQIVDSGFGQFMHERFERLAQPLVVQEFVTGDEVGIPVLRLERPYALPLVACRRRDGSQFGELPKTFDDDSVTLDTSDVLFEASDDVYRLIQSVGAAAFDALEMTGVGRIDVRLDIDGRPWVFDTNEAPPPLADTAFAVSMNALGHDLRGMLKIWLGSCLYEYGVISGIEPEGQIGQQEHATQF